VPENLYERTQYLDPVQKANDMGEQLKLRHDCDIVICLSHLGHRYTTNKVSDELLARESEYIDVIIGGHTHSFLDAPLVIRNKKNKEVIINQAGWGGIILGRLDFEFTKEKGKNLSGSTPITITKKTGQ
jgi:5'-nucleotidase